MGKGMLWGSIIAGVLIVLGIGVYLVLPIWLDPQHLRREMEKQISHALGHPITLSGHLGVSLFPAATLILSDARVEPPSGIEEKEFLTVHSLEARVKWLPLLFRRIHMERLRMEGPRLVLKPGPEERDHEESAGGRTTGGPPGGPAERRKPRRVGSRTGLWLQALALDECLLTDATVIWADGKGERVREISDLSLRAHGALRNQTLSLLVSGRLDGLPFSLEGELGPLRDGVDSGVIPLAVSIKAFGELEIGLKGQARDLAAAPELDVSVEASPFVPRRVLSSLGLLVPEALDPGALSRMATRMRLKVNRELLTVSEGSADLDGSHLAFSLEVRDYAEPAATFEVNLDRLVLERYLGPLRGKKRRRIHRDETTARAPAEPSPATADAPWKRLTLEGTLRVGELMAHGTTLRDVTLGISGREGRFQLRPVALSTYGGSLTGQGLVDLNGHATEAHLEIEATGIQAGPFLHDLFRRNVLEGTLSGRATFRMEGHAIHEIQRRLQGEGDLRVTQGAIVGVDLAALSQSMGLARLQRKQSGVKLRTPFSELLSSFTLRDGVLRVPKATMTSEGLRIAAAGAANLVEETLDFRLEPRLGGRGEAQGGAEEGATLVVPIVVSGTFASPKLRPDLDGIRKEGKGRLHLDIPGPRKLREFFKGPRPRE